MALRSDTQFTDSHRIALRKLVRGGSSCRLAGKWGLLKYARFPHWNKWFNNLYENFVEA
jgi:hypothetical protein